MIKSTHFFEILREINSLTTDIANYNKDLITLENYNIISRIDPSKLRNCFVDGYWKISYEHKCQLNLCQYCCELNTWDLLVKSNEIIGKIIDFSIPEQKIIILEMFHDFIDKQNRLNTIYDNYGTSQQIYDHLATMYETKTKTKPKAGIHIPCYRQPTEHERQLMQEESDRQGRMRQKMKNKT
jgi:hypothetical protein